MASRACLRRNGPRSGLSSESSASGAGAGEGEGFRGLAREEAEGDGDGGARRGSGDESRRGGGAADGGELSEAARPGMVLGGEGEQTASLVVEMERRGGGEERWLATTRGRTIPFGEGKLGRAAQRKGPSPASCLLARDDWTGQWSPSPPCSSCSAAGDGRDGITLASDVPARLSRLGSAVTPTPGLPGVIMTARRP
jgi:hypothetical protein